MDPCALPERRADACSNLDDADHEHEGLGVAAGEGGDAGCYVFAPIGQPVEEVVQAGQAPVRW